REPGAECHAEYGASVFAFDNRGSPRRWGGDAPLSRPCAGKEVDRRRSRRFGAQALGRILGKGIGGSEKNSLLQVRGTQSQSANGVGVGAIRVRSPEVRSSAAAHQFRAGGRSRDAR